MSAFIEKLRDLCVGAGFRHPFFLVPLSALTMVEDPDLPHHAATGKDATMRLGPSLQDLPDDEKVAVVFHEVMHPLTLYWDRMGDRDPKLWNVAHDMAINEFLKACSLRLPSGALYPPPELAGKCAEDIYDALKADPKWQRVAVAGIKPCGCPNERPNDGEGKKIDWVQVQAKARALSAGTTSGAALEKILAGRPPGLPWRTFLRGATSRALAEHGRDEQTWSRRNRRSPPGLILPGWRAVRARVAVAIDASGSVSDAQLSRAVDEVWGIGQCAAVGVYLVVHDAGVHWAGWVRGADRAAVASRIGGRGGTTFDEAYDEVAKQRVRFDALVHLTDGYVNRWPGQPGNCKRLIAAVYGAAAPSLSVKPPEGAMVVQVDA